MKAILTYHSLDSSASPISVSPASFDAHLAWFARGRVRVLDLDTLLSRPDDDGDAVSITFDDGFLNVRGAIERLSAAGLPSTVFVVTEHVGGTNAWGGRTSPNVPTLPLLSWDDLERLTTMGARVAAHSRHHSWLTRLSATEIDDELGGSRQAILDRLGVATDHVAYPYGDIDDRVIEGARRHFRCGHTTDFRFVRPSDNLMRLPRLDMYYFREAGALETWGSGAFGRRVAWCHMRRLIRKQVFRDESQTRSEAKP